MAAATMSMQNNLSELDAMLKDLNSTQYMSQKSVGSSNGYGDYSDDYVGLAPSTATSGADPNLLAPPPARPPPPKSYSKKTGSSSAASSRSNTLKLPKAHKPPKLQHILVKKRHDLVKAGPRDDDIMRAPDYSASEDEEGDYGGTTCSNYSTAASLAPPESVLPDVSDDELEKVDAGETPRGDKSMVIKTDYGELKSKYHYLGFGLWENTEPADPPPPPRKLSPPPVPPKAEPVWYNCTVSVESHKTSKELDDLLHGLGDYDRLAERQVEVGQAAAGLPGSLGDLHEPFEKEDMSEMFRRAFLEKMALADDGQARSKYKCYVCAKLIQGRVITAMTHKFHPECFVCTYCRNEFKDRSFKSDNEGKPYCHGCFEKLLGHFGSAHFNAKS